MEFKRGTLLAQIGGRMKKLREQFNLSQGVMARKFNLSNSGYFKNETGNTFPGVRTLYRLSNEHGISMDWLLFGKGPQYYKDKEKEGELVKKEEEKNADINMKPEISELLEYMAHIPLLYHEILVHFENFRVEKKELVETAMSPHAPSQL
ncbi:MAG: Helix-turn-helix protein [Acidobacteriota bacterium]|nr:Helix-turn-helix protein [Acidobacteriota bacterium]